MDDKGTFSKEELKRRLDEHELDLSLCSIVKVPVKQISSLPKVTVLDLSCNKISELPDAFCSLKNLMQIDLSKNCLTSLPAHFGDLQSLKRLDLYNNNLVSLPLSFGELRGLKWLDLKDNPVQNDLPEIVGDCLEAKDCENCARRMLTFMREMRAEEEKKRAIEAEKERQRKAAEELEVKKLNELRKRQKKEEKEQRRKAFLEEQRNKTLMQNTEDDKKEDPCRNSVGKESSTTPNLDQRPSMIRRVLRFLLILLTMAIITYFYKDILKIVLKEG